MKYADAMMLTVLSLVPVALLSRVLGTPEAAVKLLFAWAIFAVPGLMVAATKLR